MRITSTEPRAKWKPPAYDVVAPGSFLLIVAIFLGIFFGCFGSPSSENDGFNCAADGSPIMPHEGSNQKWDPKLWLSITLAFGKFSFSTAKAIDVSWDLIVGRGGQLLLAYLAYSTIRRSLAHSMMQTSWHMPVITRLTLDPVSLTGLLTSLQDLMNRRWSWRLCAYITVILYILVFTTIVSAMTGYRAKSSVYYPTGNDQPQIPASSFVRLLADFAVTDCDGKGRCNGYVYEDIAESLQASTPSLPCELPKSSINPIQPD